MTDRDTFRLVILYNNVWMIKFIHVSTLAIAKGRKAKWEPIIPTDACAEKKAVSGTANVPNA